MQTEMYQYILIWKLILVFFITIYCFYLTTDGPTDEFWSMKSEYLKKLFLETEKSFKDFNLLEKCSDLFKSINEKLNPADEVSSSICSLAATADNSLKSCFISMVMFIITYFKPFSK